MDNYSQYIATSRYARWLEDKGRRETWEETVDRYCDFILEQAEKNTSISKEHMEELRSIFNAT